MAASDILGSIGASPFPPIADYAFLSDCETCALVAPSGNVEWMCLPRFDSPSVFGSILDLALINAVMHVIRAEDDSVSASSRPGARAQPQ